MYSAVILWGKITLASFLVLGLLAAGLGALPQVAGASGTISGQSGSAQYGWTTQSLQPVSLSAIACPSSTACFAVGSAGGSAAIEETTSGGLSWTSQSAPGGVGSLLGLVCTSTADCWAVGSGPNGGAVISTSDAGSTWSEETIPSGTPTLVSIACDVTSQGVDCWAVSTAGNIIATTDGGSSWATQTTPSGVDVLDSISCPSTSNCFAVGQAPMTPNSDNESGTVLALITTTNGGNLWTNEVTGTASTLSTSPGGYAISCVPGSTQCVASISGLDSAAQSISGQPTTILTTTDGQSWSPASDSSSSLFAGSYPAITCVSSTVCFAGGSGGTIPANSATIIGSTDGGSTWTDQPITFLGAADPVNVSGVACASTNDCWVVGSSSTLAGTSAFIAATTNAGAAWNVQQTYPPSPAVSSISCISSSECLQAGGASDSPGAIAITTDGGEEWSAETPVQYTTSHVQIDGFTAITCREPSSSVVDCWVVGADKNGNAVIELTTSAGQPTSNPNPPPATNPGWTLEPAPGGITGLTAISCPTTSDCWATSNSGQVITTNDGGTSWTTETVPTGIPGLAGISCPNTSDCWAAGTSSSGGPLVLYSGNGGSTWAAQSVPSALASLNGISCPSAEDCYAVSSNGLIASTADGGSLWEQDASPANVNSYAAVTCVSTTTCWAVGPNLVISYTNDGGSLWVAQIGASGILSDLTSISCANSQDCWYGAEAGVAHTTDGGAAPPPAVTVLTPAGGPVAGGTQVIITGTNFTKADAVDFGKVAAASFQVLNATTIRATSPAVSGPETVNVTVVTSGGTSPISTADEYIYANPAAAPVVDGVIPASGPLSGGTKVIVYGTGFDNATEVSFGPNPATSVDAVSSTSLFATSPPGTLGAVNVTVTTAGGGTSRTDPTDGFVYVEAGGYTPLPAPTRICDTRSNGNTTPCEGDTLAPDGSLNVQVAGESSIPSSGVVAVVANVTAVTPAAGGYLTVYPSGVATPTVSNLNFRPGQIVPNLVEVELGMNGEITIYNGSLGSTNVLVDVEGYVLGSSGSGTSATAGALYDPITPARILDTRCAAAPEPNFCAAEALPSQNAKTPSIPAGGTITVQVTGIGSVPTGATAAVLNVTMVRPAKNGYLTVYPGGKAPLASNLNATAGEIVANRVIVGLSSSGTVSIFSQQAANVVVDVNGYFQAGSGSAFMPESPVRILDTRCAASRAPSFCAGENLPSLNSKLAGIGAGQQLTVHVGGVGNVPFNATAVCANVTVTGTTANGYLTVYPGGTRPVISDVNWSAGQTVPNMVVGTLPSSGSGTLTIYNYAGSTDVIVDVMGWYVPVSSTSPSG